MTAEHDLPFFGIPGTTHIDRAASVTARMPTPDECAAGYPAGAPVLVVNDDGPGAKVYPQFITVTFDDPHPKPEPGPAGDAAAYVLDAIAEELELVVARVDSLAAALRGPACGVVHLAAKVREERGEAPPGTGRAYGVIYPIAVPEL